VIYSVRQAWRGIHITRAAAGVKKLICVDYNYINWYRTQIQHHEMEYRIIPNFTDVPQLNTDKFRTEIVKIIFARRLVTYRGTRIFAEAAERLLLKHDNVEITFAGDGPEERFLKEKFQNNRKVQFITYSSGESLEIHRDKQIAVVPTVGSEGTSLSLLEAMASSCAVVCSNVGGMTNIVIDNYNGLMVNPEANALFFALDRLVIDKNFAQKIANEGYNTVKNGFSFELWKEKWKEELHLFQ
ncbi:MAG: glycosyltransferase family 4 protein, partial [Ruminococcus flavefaciens]|nr:glycosyltransferase family 4 protein [Ruminococcus flavefaciens]